MARLIDSDPSVSGATAHAAAVATPVDVDDDSITIEDDGTDSVERVPSDPPRDPRSRRNRIVAIGLALVVLTSGVTWWVGRQIESPAEVAARTSAPAASLITVPVHRQVLRSEIITRGTVRYGSPQPVTLPKSTLKTGSSIVTIAPTKGASLQQGDVALTVSGRPVFVLLGAQPAYRDLGIGDQGADVRQLEDALAGLGFDPGPRDGMYDARMATATAAWYRNAGWTPFGPTIDQQQALRSIKGDLFSSQSDRINAEQALATARSDQANANADVATKRAALDAAVGAASVAHLELDEASAANTPPPEAEIARLRAAANDADEAVMVARSDVDAANATATQSARAVDAAQRLVNLAQSRSSTLGGEVGDLASKTGIQVPADEVLFFPTLPVRVDDVSAALGEEISGPVMTVGSSALSVDGALTAQDAKFIRTGAAARIEASDLGVKLSGIVTVVADQPGTQGVDPQRYFLQVAANDAPATLVGSSVVLTITVGATDGQGIDRAGRGPLGRGRRHLAHRGPIAIGPHPLGDREARARREGTRRGDPGPRPARHR